MTDVFYQAGKIAHIVLDITPIVPLDDDSTDYDSLKKDDVKIHKREDHAPEKPSDRREPNIYLGVSEGATEMMSFDGFMNFTLGILDGSSVTTNNSQLTTCRATINSKWFNGY